AGAQDRRRDVAAARLGAWQVLRRIRPGMGAQGLVQRCDGSGRTRATRGAVAAWRRVACSGARSDAAILALALVRRGIGAGKTDLLNQSVQNCRFLKVSGLENPQFLSVGAAVQEKQGSPLRIL